MWGTVHFKKAHKVDLKSESLLHSGDWSFALFFLSAGDQGWWSSSTLHHFYTTHRRRLQRSLAGGTGKLQIQGRFSFPLQSHFLFPCVPSVPPNRSARAHALDSFVTALPEWIRMSPWWEISHPDYCVNIELQGTIAASRANRQDAGGRFDFLWMLPLAPSCCTLPLADMTSE